MMETVSTCRSVREGPDAETFRRSSICSQCRGDKWHCGHWQWCPHHLENWLIVIWGLDCFTRTQSLGLLSWRHGFLWLFYSHIHAAVVYFHSCALSFTSYAFWVPYYISIHEPFSNNLHAWCWNSQLVLVSEAGLFRIVAAAATRCLLHPPGPIVLTVRRFFILLSLLAEREMQCYWTRVAGGTKPRYQDVQNCQKKQTYT